MKKEYMKPSMEAIEMKTEQQLLAGSIDNISGNLPGGDAITPGGGGAGGGRAPGLFDGPEWDALLGE